ncbi:MAG: beta-1-3, beta-1-6-glucan biosynthesis protein, partial [Xanthobacteraceae bacterium]|nr:beta-1-3, beta-1-6-glucan biosynthesis protein [Xanthobacteraceae bacterium]
MRHLAAAGLTILIGTGGAVAQSGGQAAQDQGKPPAATAAEAAKDNQRKTDEFVEAQTAINGP